MSTVHSATARTYAFVESPLEETWRGGRQCPHYVEPTLTLDELAQRTGTINLNEARYYQERWYGPVEPIEDPQRACFCRSLDIARLNDRPLAPLHRHFNPSPASICSSLVGKRQ